jgi:hypothetical protein
MTLHSPRPEVGVVATAVLIMASPPVERRIRAMGLAWPAVSFHYVRIWADDDGESNLEDVDLPVGWTEGEPGVPRLGIADAGEVGRLQILDVETAAFTPDWHTGPRAQFVVFLTGWVRIETSDGDERTLPAGSVVLVEDLDGRGHVTEHEPGSQRVLVIPIGTEGY